MDFKEQVERAMNRVVKKAGEIKEISKIKYDVHDLNQDVKKLYTEIGKRVYEDLRDDLALTEDLRLKCDIVEAKLARIAALQAKESKVHHAKEGIVYCPTCGLACEESINYCPACGSSLAEEVEAEVSNVDTSTEE